MAGVRELALLPPCRTATVLEHARTLFRPSEHRLGTLKFTLHPLPRLASQ